MVPATEQYLPGDEERTGTMADILPPLGDRIQRGQTLTGQPLAPAAVYNPDTTPRGSVLLPPDLTRRY